MGWKHRLSNIRLDDELADCEYCGPDAIIVKRDRVRCYNGRQKGGRYGDTVLTYEEKVNLFGDQNFCPICLKNLSYKDSYLDHDHATGKLRGFICSDCNLGLGKLGDSIDGVGRALKYLTSPPLEGDENGQRFR